MKKFLINIAIFFAIVAVVDFSLGKVFFYLQANVAKGRTGTEYYACKNSNEDIIIMGSSRASHHYDPQVFADVLGLSCYNAGEDGNGIIMQFGRWKMISERYSPKIIIYDICSIFDLEYNDNIRYVDRLKPFCRDIIVKDYISGIFPMERIKLLSQMYRYNYKYLEMIVDCIKASSCRNGFFPLDGQILPEVINKPMAKKKSFNIDTTKISYIKRLIEEASQNGTKVFFVISPAWKGGTYEILAYSELVKLANKYSIPLFNYLDSEICENYKLFNDSYHLNAEGASVFSRDLANRLSCVYSN